MSLFGLCNLAGNIRHRVGGASTGGSKVVLISHEHAKQNHTFSKLGLLVVVGAAAREVSQPLFT